MYYEMIKVNLSSFRKIVVADDDETCSITVTSFVMFPCLSKIFGMFNITFIFINFKAIYINLKLKYLNILFIYICNCFSCLYFI